ncbi:methyltransferase domain-containing protein [Actinomadura xylanilytica]|uniref:methyltransferase domain-containing protein n=1 Tax=Actinomadura xylanilytica TaxID=887459 RepID=UPI00255B1853|nr:methyltransferase domain-containing protein [Actinomadura xylanilytica]MDL4775866.1 methyltransferase domain-containing protein [Actinomadura xylanilytica]
MIESVPRHLFVPDRALAMPDSDEPNHPIDREARPEEWRAAVDSNTAIITQFDDGAEGGAGLFSSSCSAPATVRDFLSALDLRDRDRVLEIGTGTGWTAALISHRVGSENVTSIEIDPEVLAQAEKNLKQAGYLPRLVQGDGTAGQPDGAPYDRVHVACGVSEVPHAWVEQARPGGVIVLPWNPLYGNGHLARLTVAGNGTALGRFPEFANYMMARGQRITGRSVSSYTEGTEPARSTTELDPRTVAWDSYGADIAIGTLVPGVEKRMCAADDDSGEWTLWLLEPGSGSWASVDYEPGRAAFTVEQWGDRHLWHEAAAAYLQWVDWGSPSQDRFGMTVASEGQTIWLDSPDNPINP